MTIGFIVRTRRKQLGWTQAELAEKAEIAQAQISRLESGKSDNITIDNLRRVARAFGCSVADLLPEEDRKPSSRRQKEGREEIELLSIESLAKRLSELEKRLEGKS
jgi:transcriptional regulator with XRE-family HTH domain